MLLILKGLQYLDFYALLMLYFFYQSSASAYCRDLKKKKKASKKVFSELYRMPLDKVQGKTPQQTFLLCLCTDEELMLTCLIVFLVLLAVACDKNNTKLLFD